VLSITVKRVDDGIVSNWLHDNFSIGSSIEATSAAGIFHLSETSASKILLLSAGSGITPMLSIVRYVTDLALDIDIHFHHSAKTVDDLICFDELQDLSQQQSNLTLSCNLSRQSISDALAVPHKKGRLAQEHLTGFCPDLLQREVFVCGPDAFMLHAKHLLITLGLPEAQYSQESFEIEKVDIVEDLANASFKVKFIQTGIEVDVPGDQTVLEAAENAGIYPDYSCLSGICGSCISQLISGEVEAPGAIAIDEDDPDSNDFLPCCSYPRSDLEVDL
jgi:ferredoxin-NADP reductase